MSEKDNGGPAYPCDNIVERDAQGHLRGVEISSAGMNMRDYYAAKAPISYEVALAVWGDDEPELTFDATRSAFMAVWAMLRYEWADAMLAERSK